MGQFLKSQVLKETEGKHLLTVEYFKSDKLSNSEIEVGENTCSALSKLITNQQKVALTSIFYAKLLNERVVRAKGGISIDIPFCTDLYISLFFSLSSLVINLK